MEHKNNEQSIIELINEVRSAMKNIQYSIKYMSELNAYFNSIIAYAQEKDVTIFTEEFGHQYLHDRYGIVSGIRSNHNTQAQRAVNILIEYVRKGRIVPHLTKGRNFPKRFSDIAESYLEKLEHDFKRPNTILRHKIKLMRFLEYLNEMGIKDILSLDANIVNEYFTSRCGHYCKHGIRDNIYIVKQFLLFLHDIRLLKDDFTHQLISVNVSGTPEHIPDSFSDEELARILSSVDRANPVGKRNYAILLLAAKLGMRTSDIRILKPQDIDWENHEINIIQVKTGYPLSLPLPNDIGWAIIDYLQNGRPNCETEEIFVRFRAPHTPLKNYNSILSKHMRLAGIKCDKFRHHGMHTLRSSLATKLLRMNVPLTSIQNVLGHADIESTNLYAGVDLNQLSECALEVPIYD